MDKEDIKKMLEKQMELLSEQAQNNAANLHELVEVSYAIAEIAKIIMYPYWCQEAFLASRRC